MLRFSALEYEKIIHDIEFENQQYVKQIEKERHDLESLKSDINLLNASISIEEDKTPTLDEAIKNFHKQLIHNRNNIESLKKTLDVINKHVEALTERLEITKLKVKEEEEERNKVLKHYENIWKDHKTCYDKIFPKAENIYHWNTKVCAAEEELHQVKNHVKNLQESFENMKNSADCEPCIDLNKFIVRISELYVKYIEGEKYMNEIKSHYSNTTIECNNLEACLQKQEFEVKKAEIQRKEQQVYMNFSKKNVPERAEPIRMETNMEVSKSNPSYSLQAVNKIPSNYGNFNLSKVELPAPKNNITPPVSLCRQVQENEMNKQIFQNTEIKSKKSSCFELQMPPAFQKQLAAPLMNIQSKMVVPEIKHTQSVQPPSLNKQVSGYFDKHYPKITLPPDTRKQRDVSFELLTSTFKKKSFQPSCNIPMQNNTENEDLNRQKLNYYASVESQQVHPENQNHPNKKEENKGLLVMTKMDSNQPNATKIEERNKSSLENFDTPGLEKQMSNLNFDAEHKNTVIPKTVSKANFENSTDGNQSNKNKHNFNSFIEPSTKCPNKSNVFEMSDFNFSSAESKITSEVHADCGGGDGPKPSSDICQSSPATSIGDLNFQESFNFSGYSDESNDSQNCFSFGLNSSVNSPETGNPLFGGGSGDGANTFSMNMFGEADGESFKENPNSDFNFNFGEAKSSTSENSDQASLDFFSF